MAPEHAVTVNGEAASIPHGCTVEALLARLDLKQRRVAVAVNRDIVPRSAYCATRLGDGDRVEILEAVGGG